MCPVPEVLPTIGCECRIFCAIKSDLYKCSAIALFGSIVEDYKPYITLVGQSLKWEICSGTS